jgi:GrpB-like predicted nucleotidyltransferase (UPF0157 family)
VDETVDKGWLSGLYWKQRYDDLLRDHQELIHKYEELKVELDSRHRDRQETLPYLLGGNKELDNRGS